MIKTTLLSIAKKLVRWDSKLEIYTNGEDNAYPERIERFRNNSVTASMASNVMIQYLLGKGFGEVDNLRIGSLKLINIADDIARDLTDQRGVYIHVDYDANFEVSCFKVLPFNQCRVGKKDSNEYNGKILVYSNWNEAKIDKKKVSILNVFNPDKEIIAYQVEKAGGISKYKGQVFFYNMDSQYYYPLSRIDAVSMECDNEYNASVYKNEILRRGFFGKTLVVTRPLVDAGFIKEATDSKDPILLQELRDMESERQNFKDTIKEFISVGNVGGVMHMEMDFAGDNLNDAILFKNIESNINDKLFEFTENSAMQKILMAFNNLPIALVKSPDNAMLGNSGEALRVSKETYWENTSKERNVLETIVNDLLSLYNNYNGGYVTVLPLLTKQQDESSALFEKQKAQSILKGSVGGVQALLQIQEAVAQGRSDYNAAIAIISEIYGINDELARKMLGTPSVGN